MGTAGTGAGSALAGPARREIWRGRGLAALAGLLGLILYAVSANIVFAALVRMSRDFQVAAERLAVVSAIQFTGFFLACLTGGVLADLWGKRIVLQAGAGLVLTGAAIWAAAGTPVVAAAAGLIMGLGGGILEGMGSALLADLFPTRRRFVLNMSQVAYGVGAAGAPVIMGRLLPLGVSWRWFFGGTAVFAALLLGLFAVAGLPAQTASGPERAAPDRCWWRVLTRTGLLLPCLIIFLYVFAEMGTVTFLAFYLQEIRAAPEQWAIFGISGFWLSMIFGRVLCAFVPERIPHEIVIAALLVGAAVMLLLQTGVQSWRLSFVLFALTGLAFAGAWPLIVAMVADRFPNASGTAVGAAVACGSLGCIAAPPILGPILGGARPERAFLLLATVAGSAALLLLPAIRRSWQGGRDIGGRRPADCIPPAAVGVPGYPIPDTTPKE